MPGDASDLANRLAEHCEAVCRFYLSNGRREGRYWLVGDTENSPGRSLYVRLASNDPLKPAGKWTDAATGEHGDLLDLIAANQRLTTLRDTLVEARRFLALPKPAPTGPDRRLPAAAIGSPEAARRLFAISKPISGTIAQAYLRSRGITELRNCTSLRFHPSCWYRGDEDDPHDHERDAWPALIAAVTDLNGSITGVHRTWLEPSGNDKAPVATPRRAMGHLLSNAVRIGAASDVLAAGEGLETMLSLRQALPTLPMAAALSANHLAALILPKTLRRLYVARDDDAAGHRATAELIDRATTLGIETLPLDAVMGDFNDDLRQLGLPALVDGLRGQLAPGDFAMLCSSAGGRESRYAPALRRRAMPDHEPPATIREAPTAF
jgi:hypothetical protein